MGAGILWALTRIAAAQDAFTFAPWSGASLNITPDSTTLQSALTTPIFAQDAYLDAQMGLPAASLAGGDAAGTYGVQVGLGRHTARSLQLAVERSIVSEDLTQELALYAGMIRQGSAWCHVLGLNSDTVDIISVPYEALVGIIEGEEPQEGIRALLDRIDALLRTEGELASTGACGAIPQAELAAALAPIRSVVSTARVMAAEAALIAPPTDPDDVGALPYQALASRAWDKTRREDARKTLLRYGGVVGYQTTVAEVDGVASFDAHTATVGGELLAITQGGLVGRAGVGLALSDAVGVTGDVGGAWVSRARSTHFYAVELSGRYTVADGGGSPSVLAVGAVRPTDSGLSLACGVQYAASSWSPVFSLSGELPTL